MWPAPGLAQREATEMGVPFLSFPAPPPQGNSESQIKDPLGLLWPPDWQGRDSWDGEQEKGNVV